ncbi:hypothetical protein [Polyangium sp. y55x31]|uniref:hypothetical protein n=1 Tax=Polyangium sp. y55x31 TaxID=3042688 RepID=UPI0024822810|nr:hypothetical protein [Polyangium sp. y55x31]MDI1475405.1 hypothetical protein [Polyangium sp. y55x31]
MRRTLHDWNGLVKAGFTFRSLRHPTLGPRVSGVDSPETEGNLRERVLAAWRALPPEGKRHQPPSFRALEQRYGLPGGIFSRVLNGHTSEIKQRNAERMAAALNVPLSWLLTGSAEEKPKSSPPAASSHSPEEARALAAQWARWENIDERAIEMVMSGPVYPYSPRVWLCLIEVYEANLRIAQSKPPIPSGPSHG